MNQRLQAAMQQVGQIGRAARMVWDSSPRWAIASMVVMAGESVLPPLGLYLTRELVNAGSSVLAAPANQRDFGRLVFWLAATAVVMLVTTLLRSLRNFVSEAQSMVLTDHVMGLLHAKSTAVEVGYYERAGYYNKMHMAQTEALYRPASICRNLSQLVQAAVSLLAIAGILLALQARLLPWLLAAALPAVVVRAWYARRLNERRLQVLTTERQTGYYHMLLTNELFAKEVRLLESGDLFRRLYRAGRLHLRTTMLRLSLKRAGWDLAADVLSLAVVAAVLALAGLRVLAGGLTLGDAAMLYRAFQQGRSMVSSLLFGATSLYEDSLFIRHFYEFLALPCEMAAPACPVAVPAVPRSGLTVENVSFRYPGAETEALKELSLRIAAGEHVALVGENGSGKTTLVKLLCRLYDPTAGTIRLDGTDLRDFDPVALRRQYSVLFQDYARYQMSAEENIRIGNLAVAPGDPRIREAARRAGADDVLSRLKDGYATPLGKWFDEGTELSVGQWQRVALARAFLRSSGILVLDEPTSAMDARAEYEVFQRLHELARGRTAIIISHRLWTVRMVDRIVVLHEGRLVENGAHDELIAAGGLYARMYNLQADRFR